MIFNIILTHRCQKNCLYCQNQEGYPSVPFPLDISYTLEDLTNFISKDPHPCIAFYGGEPLMGMEWMERMMDAIDARKWIIQTNAHLLREVGTAYLQRFDVVLASIDGRPHVTDHYRGEGTHDDVVANCREARDRGYKGEITARMCVSERSDIHEEVNWLQGLKDGKGAELFDGIHWQNDMMFGPREDWDDLDGWLSDSYYPGIERLVGEWVASMEREHRVRLVYPFIGVARVLLSGEPAKLHCGCGHANNNICTDGKITACPVSSDFYPIFQVGTIFDSDPSDLVDCMEVGEPCTNCDIKHVCGGRCLYANKTKPWGEDGYIKVCETVRHLVATLEGAIPGIKRLLDDGTITMPMFDYFKYNGAEIIP